MALSLETYMGGGYDAGNVLGQVQLPSGVGRVIVFKSVGVAITPLLQLPSVLLHRARPGGPHFVIHNLPESDKSVDLANFGSSTGLGVPIAPGETRVVSLDQNGAWVAGTAASTSSGVSIEVGGLPA